MAATLALHGVNFSDGTDKLILNRHGVFKEYNSTTEVWDHIEDPHFDFNALIDSENFLDHAFFVNGVDSNYSLDSDGNWSGTTNLSDSPIAKYIKEHQTRLYLGNIKIRNTNYPSRVWVSDFPENDSITWGLETGENLVTTSSSAVITSAGSLFETRNIKVGDKIIIEEGSDAGEYTVRSIDSETQITLTEELTTTDTGISFWVGSNFINVKTDDGDEIMGFGYNSNEILFFKRLSVHSYSATSGTLRQIKDAPGTSSGRSIVNMDEYTYYYDSTSQAIRRTDGKNSIIISNKIEDLIQNISSTTRPNVVGWSTDGKLIEHYIGTVTTRDGYTIDNCVVIWDTVTETWSTRSLPFEIEQSARWISEDRTETYVATSNGKVLKVNSTNKYDTYDINFVLEDRSLFPEGDDALVDFQRVKFFIDNGHDIQIAYKLLYKADNTNMYRWVHGDWRFMEGKADGEKVEFVFPRTEDRRACGIKFRFIQSSGTEEFLVEKYIVYTSNPALR